MLDNLKEVVKKAKKLNYESLDAIKFLLFGVVLVDIFGVYWFLELKKIGIALLLVSLFFLGIVLSLQRQRPNEEIPKPPKAQKKNIKKDNNDESSDLFGETNLGLPSAEDYEKRAEKSMGGSI